jgi:hypothetical protein
MLHEHAITYKDQLSIADLEYMIKKANRIGKASRQIVAVHEEKDSEGVHVYFDIHGVL